MNDNTKRILEAMKPICSTEKSRPALAEVAISGGCAYATDGRIAIKVRLDEAVEDFVPENFPQKDMNEILADATNRAQPSAKITRERNADALAKYDTNVLRWGADKKKETIRELDDYEELPCPCCGDTVYWDGYQLITEERMKEIEAEAYANINARNYECCSRLRIGEKKAYVNFRYVKSILDLSPEWRIGLCNPDTEPNAHNIWNMIAGTTPDGNAQFVIMGLRGSWHDLESGVKITIDAEEEVV